MIDPPKATKGRRMSKKTRKKSPKSSPGKAARAPSKTSARKPAVKASKATAKKTPKKAGKVAKKSGTKTGKQPVKASAKASHKAPSKKLKSATPRQSVPAAPSESAVTAIKSRIENPPSPKAPLEKAASIAAPRIATPEMTVPKPADPAKPAAAKTTPSKTPAARTPLTEGAKAPAFQLPRDGGQTVSLADYAGQKLVLFFYPRADTPGCTKEAIDFTRLAGPFAETGTAVLGVSADPVKAQEAFRHKHELAVPLASDETHEMLEDYGVWGEKSMYGKVFLGIVRTTVLIGADGRVIRIWRNVRVDGHADEVLDAARAS
jgi:peroxiredoxin Q/BCP